MRQYSHIHHTITTHTHSLSHTHIHMIFISTFKARINFLSEFFFSNQNSHPLFSDEEDQSRGTRKMDSRLFSKKHPLEQSLSPLAIQGSKLPGYRAPFNILTTQDEKWNCCIFNYSISQGQMTSPEPSQLK